MEHDDLRYFLAIYKPPLDKDYFDKFESYFKSALQTSSLIIKERIDRPSKCPDQNMVLKYARNKTNDLILNLTPENVTQHSRIVTTTRKGSSTPTKMSKIIGRQIH